MRVIFCLILMTSVCFGDAQLHRYTDKVSGDERGIAYSSKDGIAAVNNPDWNAEVITENQKDFYINERKKQLKQKEKDAWTVKKAKRKTIKTKLKGLGLTQSEVDEIVGESD